MGLLVTFVLGLFFLLGAFFVRFQKHTKTIEILSISIALGTMSALVIFDLIPEMLEHMEGISFLWVALLILLGIVILKGLDFFVPDHDDHEAPHHCSEENLVHIGIVSLIAIVLHNIIEGMAVYSLAVESFKTGLFIALGVGLHNIPMGMVIATTMEHEKKSHQILAYTLAVLSTFVGGLLMLLIHSIINDFVIGILICITLGMILYIVLFELIPHVLHAKNKKMSLIGFIIGMGIILISTFFE